MFISLHQNIKIKRVKTTDSNRNTYRNNGNIHLSLEIVLIGLIM